MKIAIATSVYKPQINGVAVFAGNLAEGLARRGNEVLVITPSQTKRAYTEEKNGTTVHYLKSSTLKVYPDQIHPAKRNGVFYKHGFKASILPARQIKKILDDFRPDVIHVQGSDPIGVAAVKYARRHQIPVILTEHNQPEVLTEPLHVPALLRRPTNKALSAYFVNREKKVDYVTMPTKLSIELLLKGRDLGVPIDAVSNGVDLNAFRPGEPSDHIYNIYDIPKDVPIILYIGRLDPEKKVEVAIDAFSDFLNNHKLDNLSKTLFVVVGDGVDKKRLMEKARGMGISDSVKFLGRVTPPDLYELYRLGDVFVTASEIETQGIVLIEAAATGLPLIAVDAGAVKEVCQDGVNGRLIGTGDVRGISDALTEILEDEEKRRQMSKKSLEIASEHSLGKTLDKFLEIYQSLINRV